MRTVQLAIDTLHCRVVLRLAVLRSPWSAM